MSTQCDWASAECCYFRTRFRSPHGQGKQPQFLQLFLTCCSFPAWVTCLGCLSMCLGKCGAYNWAPYSRWSGQEEYSGAITSLHLGTVFLFIQLAISLAFLATTSDCWLLWSLWSTKSPWSFSHTQLLSPVYLACICAVRLWISKQDFTFTSVQLYLAGFVPGSSLSRFFGFVFIFQFNILAVLHCSESWEIW